MPAVFERFSRACSLLQRGTAHFFTNDDLTRTADDKHYHSLDMNQVFP